MRLVAAAVIENSLAQEVVTEEYDVKGPTMNARDAEDVDAEEAQEAEVAKEVKKEAGEYVEWLRAKEAAGARGPWIDSVMNAVAEEAAANAIRAETDVPGSPYAQAARERAERAIMDALIAAYAEAFERGAGHSK